MSIFAKKITTWGAIATAIVAILIIPSFGWGNFIDPLFYSQKEGDGLYGYVQSVDNRITYLEKQAAEDKELRKEELKKQDDFRDKILDKITFIQTTVVDLKARQESQVK